jgi:hypothetical protein
MRSESHRSGGCPSQGAGRKGTALPAFYSGVPRQLVSPLICAVPSARKALLPQSPTAAKYVTFVIARAPWLRGVRETVEGWDPRVATNLKPH